MKNVEVESNCQTLIKALQSSVYDRAPEGILLREIWDFARLSFSACTFYFAPKACNNLVHALAAFGASQQAGLHLWLEDLPDKVLV
ncbi:hypothetical protein ZWY2020_009731 [Hordeum vulgare]|uniref:RNase H type-1 domain-containing protein n=1 Tax=Hordeum vulgare subsp. vulgare TaxID=112509 RepID=A0A8I6XAC5_HORVV|nr:hypothetical protein ZWY2020_009731 [Hordeum vulgare]